MEAILPTYNQVKDELIEQPNVVGTATGLKRINGQCTGQQAILVFVEKKYNPDEISAHCAEISVPPTINGFPTDVIETGKIIKHSFRDKIRPIQPGYSCGHKTTTAGTIGGLFVDRHGDLVILSNSHVLANEGRATTGDLIYQPGPADAGGGMGDIGTLKSFSQIQGGMNKHDSAIARVHNHLIGSGVSRNYPSSEHRMIGIGRAIVGQQVRKWGRTTGHTTGKILALNATFTIGYNIGPAKFDGCVVMTSMSKPGDSGSLIFDDSMNAVALLFAGSPKVTLANPIDRVVDEYGLKVWTGEQINSPNPPAIDWQFLASPTAKLSATDGTMIITASGNQHAVLEKRSGGFTSLEATIASRTDCGATWGPGISLHWPNGMLKVNLRAGGNCAGYYNGDENITKRPSNSPEVQLRIFKSKRSWIGEIVDGGNVIKLLEVATSALSGLPQIARAGKTGEKGVLADYGEAGQVGECVIKNLRVR